MGGGRWRRWARSSGRNWRRGEHPRTKRRYILDAPPPARTRTQSLNLNDQNLIRRYTKDRARFTEHTEVVLWTCKEFWQEVFGKRVDNLKTNNRGVYVLTDTAFVWMAGLRPIGATEEEGMSTMRSYAESYGRFAGGVVRGALEALGLRCVVSCEPVCSITGDPPPGCKFTVRLTGGLGFGGIA